MKRPALARFAAVTLLTPFVPACSATGMDAQDHAEETQGHETMDSVDADHDSDDDDSGNPDGDDEPVVDQGNYDVSDFDWVDPRGDAHQPLTRASHRVIRSDELAVLIADEATGRAGFALDDRVSGGHLGDLAESPAGDLVHVVRGDLDEDGQDEGLGLRMDAAGDVRLTLLENVDGELFESVLMQHGAGNVLARLATGDMDGDLRDEIFVGTLTGSGQLSVQLLDDLEDFGSLDVLYFPETASFDIATGDFDGDGLSELVVFRKTTAGDLVAHFHGLEEGLVELEVLQGHSLPIDEEGFDVHRIQVVAGDVDGDRKDEVVFGKIATYVESGTVEMRIFAHDDAENGRAFLESQSVGTDIHDWALDRRVAWHLDVADLNADERKEVVALLPDLDQQAGTKFHWVLHHFSLLNDQLGDDAFASSSTVQNVGEPMDTPAGAWMTVLDDTRDGREVVAVSILGATGPDAAAGDRVLDLRRYGSRTEDVPAKLGQRSHETFPIETAPGDADRWINPVILGLDLDADSLKLEYTGEKWLTLPDPFVILVMAAPPVETGISQNLGLSATAYGHEVSSGTSHAEEVSTAVGATISFETPAIAGIFTYDASVSIERELGKTHTNTEIVTHGTSFGGSALHDYVIFQGTLYTSYRYRVVAAADPEVIGTYMTIDEPVSTKLYKWTVDYFNEAITDPNHHIGAEVFTHTPGDVSSYGDVARRNQRLATHDGWTAQSAATVGQGSGNNRTTIDLYQESADTTNLTITKSVAAGGSVAGIGYEGSLSFAEGEEWTISVGERVTYEGSVGDISDPADYEAFGYDFGLFVYNYEDPAAARSFQVVDYWASNLRPGHGVE